MPIPKYQELTLPLLRFLADGEEHAVREAVSTLAREFQLSTEEQQEMIPSGRQPLLRNRVGWAQTHMKKAGLLEYPRRGYIRITNRGRTVLQDPPEQITDRYLMRFPEFQNFKNKQLSKTDADPEETAITIQQTPDEIIRFAHQELRTALANDLLDTIKDCSPTFFEQLVIDLLVAMGYGGNHDAASQAVGRSGDGGIDGIISEDRLGLDVIYLQAKRWTHTVGRPEIQRFAGALHGQRARKGVFITTSDFTREARDYAASIDIRIILIDGDRLTELMIDHGVGVSTVQTLELKRIDRDYFSED